MNRSLMILLLILTTGIAQAEWRCDCTKVTGSCSADVDVQGNWVNVASSSQSCSRVDYFLDGQPFVTVVVDGEAKQNWLARTQQPDVLVQSCQVCQDNLLNPAAAGARPADEAIGEETAATSEEPAGLAPLIQMQPAYPTEARAAGVEGYAVVSFKVQPDGTVANVRIDEARPQGTFERAAIEAVSRWRYPADDARGPVDQRERLDFRLSAAAPAAAVFSLPEAAPAEARPGRDGRVVPRNECIREAAAFDFVDRVEVELVNACGEPVVVYACAAGTREYVGQWFCADRTAALVGRDDARLGRSATLDTRSGGIRYRYDSAYTLVRAPRTAYWWVGCALNDLDCHEAAEGWRQYVHLKPADVDPRRGASLTVTASR